MTFRDISDLQLRPEDTVLVLMDRYSYHLAVVNSHDAPAVVNNTPAPEMANAFNVPVASRAAGHR